MLMILVYFPSGRCVNGVVYNQTNQQFTSITVIHFMNSARGRTVQKKNRKTVFNVYVCLNHNLRYEHNQFERRDEKPRYQRQFFQNLDNFYI